MKKALLLKPMLLLFALIVGMSSAWGQDTYVKVTNEPSNWSGEYILVYENGTTASVWKGVDGSGNYSTATISEETIIKPSDAVTIIVSEMNGGYSMLVNGGTNDGKYMKNASSNGISFVNTATANTLSNDGSSTTISCGSKTMRFNTSYGFRYYGSGQQSVQLYIKNTTSGPINPDVTINNTKIAVNGTATISYPSDLDIEFISNNTSVATVDDDGKVTGVSAGEAKITATWQELANTYNSGSIEFTVKVVEPTVYNKVTQFSQLVAGNKYILVAIDNNKAMGAIENNNTYRSPVDVTVSNNQVTIVDEAVAELTLGIGTEAWTFLAGDNQEYLALNSASKALHSTATKNDNTNWTVTTDFQLESSNHSDWILQYNASSPRFACYSSAQKQAVLFVKAGSPEVNPVSITPNKAITTYVTPNNLNFSSVQGLEAYVATAASGGVVTLVKVSGNVPVGTPLLLKGTASTPYSVSVASSATAPATNLLQAGDGETTIGGANVYDYILKNGLWYRANEGILAADKAYLHCDSDPTVGGAPELSMDWGEDTTGIININSGTITDNQYYTLDGRRVAEPTKGIYILNGKKVIVK